MTVIDLIIKPDQQESEVAEILVEGKIEGRNYQFLLDTGAATSALLSDAYLEKLEVLSKSTGTGVFASADREVVRLTKLEIGPITKKSFEVEIAKEKHVGARNLLGMDFLKDYSYAFCFDKNKVEVNPIVIQADYQELTMGRRHHPYIDIKLQEVEAKAIWDTGAGITVVDVSFIQKNSELFEEIAPSKGTDSSGATQETPMFTMKSTRIANIDFPSHKVAGIDLSYVNKSTEIPMDMILGYSTLCKANWFFDFQSKKWAVLKML
ncbi:aspartyl protease family protein [Planococcus maritimus]|uniref:Aspartyl protease family protein n=1 Tax=Planococcus maritimus TaxID=192421 RepID=A0A7D7QZB3_PLAMR|nr:retropepsin-like aspartic protease [Planococcus maritimus]QMT16696.1 aspartyl protease family protein [Planococcus maritimus]